MRKTRKELSFEQLLRKANEETGMRPEFYRRLLDAEVLVPIEAPYTGRIATVPAGVTIGVKTLLRKDGIGVIPFYSSPRAVFEGNPMGEKCVIMHVRELFESRPDMHFHLNPFSQFGREFLPHEVTSLLATGLPDCPAVKTDVDTPKFAAPRDPPTKLLDSLHVLFSRNAEVERAFAAECLSAEQSEPTSILIAIEASEDQERIIREVANVVQEHVERPRLTIDVTILERNNSETSQYFFNEAAPFYERASCTKH